MNNSDLEQIIIADCPAYLNIWQKLKTTEEEAMDRAYMMGIRDFMLIVAISNVMRKERMGDLPLEILDFKVAPNHPGFKKIHMMSHIINSPEHSEIDQNFKRLMKLLDEDSHFANQVYDLIPVQKKKEVLGNAATKKSYDKLTKSQQEEIKLVMGYAVYQTAITISIGGVKYGHQGEIPYDDLADYVITKHSGKLLIHQAQIPKYKILDDKEVYQGAPYRVVRNDIEEVIGLKAKPWNKLGDSMYMGNIDTIYLPIFYEFLQCLETSKLLNQEMKEKIKKAEIMHMLCDLAEQLKAYPGAYVALELSGVTKLLSGEITIEQLSDYNHLPISTKRVQFKDSEEADEAVLIRHFARVMSGPIELDQIHHLKGVLGRFFRELYGALHSNKKLGINLGKTYYNYHKWCKDTFGELPHCVNWKAQVAKLKN